MHSQERRAVITLQESGPRNNFCYTLELNSKNHYKCKCKCKCSESGVIIKDIKSRDENIT